MDDSPTRIGFGVSQDSGVDGIRFRICLYPLKQDTECTREDVDGDDASRVWGSPLPVRFRGAK